MLDRITLTPIQLRRLIADGRLDPTTTRQLGAADRQRDPAFQAEALATARFRPGLPLLLRGPTVSPAGARTATPPQETAASARAAAALAFAVDQDDPALQLSLVGRPVPRFVARLVEDAIPEQQESDPQQPGAAALVEIVAAVPVFQPASLVRSWFDRVTEALIPVYDSVLSSDRLAAEAFQWNAKAPNTRRAYRAGVQAWCRYTAQHALPCLPARAEDIAAFLAAERRRGAKANTIALRRAALRYLHRLAHLPVPTDDAQVGETVAGIRRAAARAREQPIKKRAATLDVLSRIVDPIDIDLTGLRDRALLLLGFAGPFRRSELAGIQVADLVLNKHGLRVTLHHSKGERDGGVVRVAVLSGTERCPVRALYRWLEAAGITEGAVFRRVRRAAKPGTVAGSRVGDTAIDPSTVARIVQARAAAAGFERGEFGGHSLKRGALNEGHARKADLPALQALGRHKSLAALGEYLEPDTTPEASPLWGVL